MTILLGSGGKQHVSTVVDFVGQRPIAVIQNNYVKYNLDKILQNNTPETKYKMTVNKYLVFGNKKKIQIGFVLDRIVKSYKVV